MNLSTKIDLKDLEKYDKLALRLDNYNIMEISLFDGELSIDIKTEHAKFTKIQRKEIENFNDIIKQCDKLDKKDVVKCCEDFYKKLHINYKDMYNECKTENSNENIVEDKTKDIEEKAKEHINNKECFNIEKEIYGNPIDDFIKEQKRIDPKIYQNILSLAKKWEEKGNEKYSMGFKKLGELEMPKTINHYKIKKENGK